MDITITNIPSRKAIYTILRYLDREEAKSFKSVTFDMDMDNLDREAIKSAVPEGYNIID